jgi:hypothetical protein
VNQFSTDRAVLFSADLAAEDFPVHQRNRRAAALWVFVLLVVTAGAVGILMRVSPTLFLSEEKPPPVVTLKTGGTSSAALMMNNVWRMAYRRA